MHIHNGSPIDPEPMLTPAEVAQLFRVDPKTVTRWANAGRLNSVRTLGGHRRYREAEVRALLNSTDTQAGPQAVPGRMLAGHTVTIETIDGAGAVVERQDGRFVKVAIPADELHGATLEQAARIAARTYGARYVGESPEVGS